LTVLLCSLHIRAKQLAKKYYDKLFKEYCIADLSRYKENKIAMRWRIEKEVQEGKGKLYLVNELPQQMMPFLRH